MKSMNQSLFRSFGNSLFTAFFIFLLEIILVIAFTALMYPGELSNQIPRALGLLILGDACLCALVACFSSNPGSIALQQDAPGAMLAGVTAGMVTTLSGLASQQFATVTLMIVSTTLFTGFLLLGLGYFKLGRIVRFLPYPIIGGFLAGSGWLLVQGGISIMANTDPGLQWFQADILALWVPGVVLGVIIYTVSVNIAKPYLLPLLMLGATLLFYGIAWITHRSFADLRSAGWLLDISDSTSFWEFPLSPSLISEVNWSVLTAQVPAMIPIAMISAIGLLLNSSGMEVLTRKDFDLSLELKVAGFGNLLAGLAGGLVGFQDISASTLNHRMSGGRRLVGILTALMLGATLFVGTSFILFVPKVVFGSVLIYLGIELLFEWVYKAWFKFSRNYSRVSVIKFALTGQEFRSRVSHSPSEQKILDAHGDQIFIMILEGFIFFGTANGIFEALREHLKNSKTEPVKYFLVDFSKVSGIDSTGMLSFNRMIQWSQEQGITLVFSGLEKKAEEHFLMESAETGASSLQFFPNLDRGLEWCENKIISGSNPDSGLKKDIAEQLNDILKGEGVGKLLPFLQRREYHPGEYLIREGDAPDFIFFIHSGQVTAQLEIPGKTPVRLETMSSGRTVGEIAFYLGTRRTASVVADLDSVVYSLSIDDLKNMEATDPETATIFHRISALLLSKRVVHLTRTVRALERS